MRLGVVGDLVAHSGLERKGSSIRELGVQLAFDAQDDVTLRAPVIRNVAG